MSLLQIIILCILAAAGASALLIWLRNQRNRRKNSSLISRAGTGRLNYDQLTEELNLRVGLPFRLSKRILMSEPALLLEYLRTLHFPGTTIFSVLTMPGNRLLIVTEASFEDQVTITFSTTTNVKKLYATNYILEYLSEKDEYVLKSSLYENDDTLRIRTRFRENFIRAFSAA